jgi:hypothetical protein
VASKAALTAALMLIFPLSSSAGGCPTVRPVACPHCFAVAVMPDTQNYTDLAHQPQGAAHLDLVTRYLCRERTSWVEPRTGKQMPISMVIQLGDLVQSGDLTEAVSGPLAEWVRLDAAFDNLGACALGFHTSLPTETTTC